MKVGTARTYYQATLGAADGDPDLPTPCPSGDPTADPRRLHEGIRFPEAPLCLPSPSARPRSDWLWSLDMIPMVNERVRQLIASLSPQGCQFLPIRVCGHDGNEPYPLWVLNILDRRDCVDPGIEKSDLRVRRPRGAVPGVHAWRADPALTDGLHILRPTRMPWSVLLSEEMVDLLAEEGVSGALVFEA